MNECLLVVFLSVYMLISSYVLLCYCLVPRVVLFISIANLVAAAIGLGVWLTELRFGA